MQQVIVGVPYDQRFVVTSIHKDADFLQRKWGTARVKLRRK